MNFDRYSDGGGGVVVGVVRAELEGSRGRRSQNIFLRDRILPIWALISFSSTFLSPRFPSLLAVHNLKA